MFSHLELPVMDFKTMPESARLTRLEGLKAANPQRSHFVAGGFYNTTDADGKVITVKMLHDVFLLIEDKKTYAWYSGSVRGGVLGYPVNPFAYMVASELLCATDAAHFEPSIKIYVLDVDFEHRSLKTLSARYLAFLLPRLVQEFQVSYFKKGTKILNLGSNILLWLTLSHSLVPRESSRYPKQDRFALIGDLLGEGSFSDVYPNTATLRIIPDHLFKKTERPRVARFTFVRDPANPHSKGLLPEAIQREDTIMQTQRDRLKSKPSFFKRDRNNPSSEVAIRFERRLPGKNLADILDDADGMRRWSLVRRLRTAIALLRALHEQVHEKGVIHCDVKPANVMVADGDGDFPLVNIIDFNLSRLKSDISIPNKAVGTTAYFSPERFNVRFIPNEASDVFAAGVTVAELFFHSVMFCPGSVEKLIAYASDYQFIYLFGNLPTSDMGLEREADRATIERVLTALVHADPSQRPSLMDAVTMFELVLSRLTQELAPDFQSPRVGV